MRDKEMKHSKKTHCNKSRRHFIGQVASIGALASTGLIKPSLSKADPLHSSFGRPVSQSTYLSSQFLQNHNIGFNGYTKDRVIEKYVLANGTRIYNPVISRFHSLDSMSPFGRGGTNSYAYCLGDPINKRDPSGHFAIMAYLISAIIGAIVGAITSTIVEGIRSDITGDPFDWKQVAIGTLTGFISGGFGAIGQGSSLLVKTGLALGSITSSALLEFGINSASGMPLKDAGIQAGIGAGIGLITFGVGTRAQGGIFKVTNAIRNLIGRGSSIIPGGHNLGKDFVIYYKSGNPGVKTKDLLFSSHGSHSNFGRRVVARYDLKYYSNHGNSLVDEGFGNFGNRGVFGFRSLKQKGSKSFNYTLTHYEKDHFTKNTIASSCNFDVAVVRPGIRTTTEKLQNSLLSSNHNYSSIQLVHCRSYVVGAKPQEAMAFEFAPFQ